MSNRQFLITSCLALCITIAGFGWIIHSVYIPAPPSHPTRPPAFTIQLAPPQMKDADGFPTPKDAGSLMVTECARASGIRPDDRLTMEQVTRLTGCVDLVRAGLRASR